MADDKDPSEAPTPRASGTLQRAPVYIEWAKTLIERLEEVRLKKTKILSKLDIQGAKNCAHLQKELTVLIEEFESWAREDPGPAIRPTRVLRLREIELMVDRIAPRA